ncbi:hypothetical protein EK21DRAFT_57109 [Setomelanomma holmii]|uniref:Cyclin N-terminal domain-containing protein n=1 Tax=Setomelanomma holmii TaxID=210430 RepID=A0A9P4LSW4_9PLEO|nr:hypothetical protein EK21DRAFT_57109 [Setomelanomma holmii]
MDYSPALSTTSDMTDEELDRYLATYVPLSNLPTPPPAREHVSAVPSSASTSTPSSQTQPSFPQKVQAYAVHLANLVPSNVSTHRPHTHVMCSFLDRANLPDEVVAFAACVLDNLSTRFGGLWRDILAPAEFERDLKNFLKTDSTRHAHLSPDIIVLAALALAHGFLTDRLRSSRHWSVKESGGMFTVREIEATKRAVLVDMDYGLSRISNDMVQRMSRDMQRSKTIAKEAEVVKDERRRTLSLNLSGTAIWNHGLHTPEPSP